VTNVLLNWIAIRLVDKSKGLSLILSADLDRRRQEFSKETADAYWPEVKDSL